VAALAEMDVMQIHIAARQVNSRIANAAP